MSFPFNFRDMFVWMDLEKLTKFETKTKITVIKNKTKVLTRDMNHELPDNFVNCTCSRETTGFVVYAVTIKAFIHLPQHLLLI